MYLYDTDWNDADVARRNDAESVDAWMRAAAYAAGDDPEQLLSLSLKNSVPGIAKAQPELELVS